MGKRILFFLACAFMSASMALAQKQVTGTVLDSETGEPIPGAAVKVPGTTLGTLTNADGKFVITNVPNNSKTVTVSFMGMKPVEVAIRPNLSVSLESEEKVMDEVMVTAYGTTKRSTFTGAAVELKAEDIQKHVTSTATNALIGKVAGLQAGKFKANGIKNGLIITHINQQPIDSQEDVEQIYNQIMRSQDDDKVMVITGLTQTGKKVYYAVDLSDVEE